MHKIKLQECSQTKWSAQYQAVTALTNNLTQVAMVFEKIKTDEMCTRDTKYEASNLHNSITDFHFILNLIVWNNILREINRVDNEIQNKHTTFGLNKFNGAVMVSK